jgi:hypothetical protein
MALKKGDWVGLTEEQTNEMLFGKTVENPDTVILRKGIVGKVLQVATDKNSAYFCQGVTDDTVEVEFARSDVHPDCGINSLWLFRSEVAPLCTRWQKKVDSSPNPQKRSEREERRKKLMVFFLKKFAETCYWYGEESGDYSMREVHVEKFFETALAIFRLNPSVDCSEDWLEKQS